MSHNMAATDMGTLTLVGVAAVAPVVVAGETRARARAVRRPLDLSKMEFQAASFIVNKGATGVYQYRTGTSSSQGSGGGLDPDWWKRINQNEEGLSPLKIFQLLAQEVLLRLDGASESERLDLLQKLREAFANLLNRLHNLTVSIKKRTRNVVLDDPDGDAIEITPELIELLGAFREDDLDLGEGGDTGDSLTCIYRIRCRDCGANYVGQTVGHRERLRNHRSSMKAKDKSNSLYQHHAAHRCVYGCNCNFEESYSFTILMVFRAGTPYTTLRAAEVFWQWLLKALEDDEGTQ